MRLRFIAIVMCLAPAAAPLWAAGGTRVEQGGAQPTITIQNPTNPALNPGVTNGVKTETGINTQTGGVGVEVQNPNAGGMGADATMTGTQGQFTAPGNGVDQGGRVNTEGVGPGLRTSDGTAPRPVGELPTGGDRKPINSVRKETAPQKEPKASPEDLNRTVDQIKKNAAPPGDAAADLSHIFDAAHKFDAKIAGPAGAADSAGSAVAGKAQAVKDSVVQSVRIANEPSTHPADVPGLYLAGKAAIRAAASAGVISKPMAQTLDAKMDGYARDKAATSMPELANGAYQAATGGAAGEREVERAVGPKDAGASDIGMKPRKPSAFEQWQEMLGSRISNLDRLRQDVWRVQEESAKAGASASRWAPKISFKLQDGAYLAVLPNSSVSRIPELTAALALGPSFGPEAVSELAQYEREPSLSNAFRAARRRSGLTAAAGVWVRSAAMNLWQWVWEGFLSLIGRGPAQVLAKMARTPSSEEAQITNAAGAVFTDFSSVNGPYVAAQRILSQPGALTVAQAKRALAQTALLAQAGAAISSNGAGVRAVARLRALVESRLAGLKDSEAVPASASELIRTGEGGDLSSWLERLHTAALDKLDAGGLKTLAAQNGPALVYADLAGGSSMIRVYLKSSDGGRAAAGLSNLGYRIQSAGGWAIAVFDWESGSEGSAALGEALSLLKADSPRTENASAAEAVEVDAAIDSYLRRAGKDHLSDFEAADPGLAQFVPVDVVERGARGFWVERSRRRLGGRVQDLILLRDLRTRRTLYGQAFAIPGH